MRQREKERPTCSGMPSQWRVCNKQKGRPLVNVRVGGRWWVDWWEVGRWRGKLGRRGREPREAETRPWGNDFHEGLLLPMGQGQEGSLPVGQVANDASY